VIDNAWKDENEEMKHWKFQLPFDNIGLKTEITATMSKFPIRGRVERIQTEGKYVTAVSLSGGKRQCERAIEAITQLCKRFQPTYEIVLEEGNDTLADEIRIVASNPEIHRPWTLLSVFGLNEVESSGAKSLIIPRCHGSEKDSVYSEAEGIAKQILSTDTIAQMFYHRTGVDFDAEPKHLFLIRDGKYTLVKYDKRDSNWEFLERACGFKPGEISHVDIVKELGTCPCHCPIDLPQHATVTVVLSATRSCDEDGGGKYSTTSALSQK
jgi:hypothetical protein